MLEQSSALLSQVGSVVPPPWPFGDGIQHTSDEGSQVVTPHAMPRSTGGGGAESVPASIFRVNAADAAWVDRQCTMHPLSSCEEPARLSGACDGIANIGYILASGYDGPFGQFYAQARERRWWLEELGCGHDVTLDMPNELTALLLQRT